MEVMPFIEEILNNIRAIICDLQPLQVHTFYEAVGYMIQAQVVGVVIDLNSCVLYMMTLYLFPVYCRTRWSRKD